MEGWRQKNRPECLEKRFEFESYEKTRDFLDALGDYCEKVNRFPDISFGKTYVRETIYLLTKCAQNIKKVSGSFIRIKLEPFFKTLGSILLPPSFHNKNYLF